MERGGHILENNVMRIYLIQLTFCSLILPPYDDHQEYQETDESNGSDNGESQHCIEIVGRRAG